MSVADRGTFSERWQAAVASAPARPFLIWEGSDGAVHEWSYAEFDRLVGRVAGRLAELGVDHGSAVHLVLRNSPAFVAVWLACIRLRAWIVPSDPESTAAELREHQRRTRPRLGICAIERADACHEAAGAPRVIEVSEDDTTLEPLTGPEHAHPEPADLYDRAAVMFTSGTTSAPKGVVVTQANYAFAGDVMAAAAALTAADRQLVVLPLFHGNAQYYSVASAISAGASVALMHTFSASRFLAQAARHEATHASLFAAPMRMILARGVAPTERVRLRHVWYAQNVTDEQYETLAERFGCRPRQLYGMTETIPAVLVNPAVDPTPDAMGAPAPGCEVEIFADGPGGEPAAAGEVGEIAVRGRRGITLFAEYLDDPVTTEAAFEDGWFRTGDYGWRDERGLFHFAGRRSDVLKVAGENVSTPEIEAVLANHPSVLEAAVVSRPDAVRDEIPVAFVVPRPDAPAIDAGELERHCARYLAPAKRPHHFYVVDELPRTSVGKIRKFLLKERFGAEGQ